MSIVDTARVALHAELQEHGLLSAGTDGLANVARPDLLPRVLALCFPEFDLTAAHVNIVFESPEARARIEQALLFGWVTADLLVYTASMSDDRSHLLCALFNLGVGMIDGLCDTDPHRGAALMEFVRSVDLESAASEQWQEGRMLASLSAGGAADPTITFIARVIDAFFSLLHATQPLSARRQVGRLLADAFRAEQRSVALSSAAPAELLEASRNTSVLPFLIIATLMRGDIDAATHLGEAMWRVDDLIDLELDAQSGALNSLLLEGTPDRSRIEAVAHEAAGHLRAGLGAADGRTFLWFVRRYVQVTSEGSTPR
jgi:hypothetical protein